MRIKIILAVAAVAFVAWLIFSTRGNDDADEVQRLARKMAERNEAQRVVNADEIGVARLGDTLTAERDESSGFWEIHSGTGARITLPYSPDHNAGPVNSDAPEQDANPGFVGAQQCAECHRQRHDGFVHTAHHKTSSPASVEIFHGPVDAASTVPTSDIDFTHQVVKRGDAYFQSIDFHGWNHLVPMQVVTGSSKTGQTYLYWDDDRLFQTHISYLTATDEWIPSPGYTASDANFTRAIRSGCLECHITFISETRPPNHYQPASAVWGISCERCHGPGKKHIDFHRQHPNAASTKFITSPSKLSRTQQLHICGQCHWGSFKLKKPAFTFRPGDDITQYHEQLHVSDKVGSIHTSNQLTRLEESSCFQQTEMTCTTCHDPHRNERGNTALFSKSCLKCHQQQHCGMSAQIGDAIAGKCITCHMPMTEDVDMPLDTRRGRMFPSMVDHYIRVDREATDRFLTETASAEAP